MCAIEHFAGRSPSAARWLFPQGVSMKRFLLLWCCLAGGLLAAETPPAPTAQMFAALKAAPPTPADPINRWTGVWRGTMRGRESNFLERPTGFHDARKDDLTVTFIQQG
jgi:hypothetical protein